MSKFSNKVGKGVAPMLALVMMSCIQDPPTQADSGKDISKPVAARTAIGSTQDVTWIRNLADLRNMRLNLAGNYKLANKIDASETANTPFVPVGGLFNPFQGTFDGNDFEIDKLTIQGGEWTGMFGQAMNALLTKVRLTNVNITGGFSTGAIAGFTQNVDLNLSYVTGTVTGNADGNRIGMAVGTVANWTRISRCYATGTVQGTGSDFGGFAGRANFYGELTVDDDPRVYFEEIFTNVTVAPTLPSGGGDINSGGLVGYLVGGVVNNINTVGQVTGRGVAGGVLGFVDNEAPNSKATIIRGTVSRGIVTDAATPQRAGAIGHSTGKFSWCGASYWDNEKDSGIPNPNMSDKSCQFGKSSNELKAPYSNSDPMANPLDRLLEPYIYGLLVTRSNYRSFGKKYCNIRSGSDGDWGVGTCNETPRIWSLNTNGEYNTLLRIPNPGVQPKL